MDLTDAVVLLGAVLMCWLSVRAVLALGPRVKQIVALVALGTLIVLLYLTDWPGEELSQFWSEHALLSGTLTSVLLFGAGLLSADARLERRRQRLSDHVLRSVFYAVAEVVDEVAATLRDCLHSERGALNGEPMADAAVRAVIEVAGRLQVELATWLPVLGALPDGRGHEALAAGVRLRRTAGLTGPEDDAWTEWYASIGRLGRSYELWLYATLRAVDESQLGGIADVLPSVVPARADLLAARESNARRLRRGGRWARLQRLAAKRGYMPADYQPESVCDLVEVVESAVAVARLEFPDKIEWEPPGQYAPVLLQAGFERGLAGALGRAAAAQEVSHIEVGVRGTGVGVTVTGPLASEVKSLFADTTGVTEANFTEGLLLVTLELAADRRLAGHMA